MTLTSVATGLATIIGYFILIMIVMVASLAIVLLIMDTIINWWDKWRKESRLKKALKTDEGVQMLANALAKPIIEDLRKPRRKR